MCKFTWYYTIMVLLFFLQHQIVSSSMHLSPSMPKIALFQFKQSLTISTPRNCSYYEIPSHPKTMNWSMSSNHCTWEGVSCEHKTGNVIGLDLSCSQLEGAILANSTLFQLSHLQFLNLSQNDFSLSNEFPQEFGFFAKGSNYEAKLEEEVFKSVMQNMSQLRVLNLESVNISSVVPMNLSTSLRVLNLGYTGLHGELPQEVFHLPNLQVLDLSTSLRVVDLYNTGLYGELPQEVFHLPNLQVLRLSGNSITGMLPTNLSTSLRVLNLGSTGLHGELPQEVFHLPNLQVLDLSWNTNLTGMLPTNLSTSLRVLNLGLTGLHGELPQEVFHLPNLEVLVLSPASRSKLTGRLPKVKWGSSATLRVLMLFDIDIDGGIPDSIGFLESLSTLELFYCNLSGPIPTSIGNLGQLSYLGLVHSNLNGPIPTFIGNLGQLILLSLSGNNLNGPIPTFIGNLGQLTFLDLKDNNFSGVLDIEMFSSLEYLHSLDLSHNNLSVKCMATLPSTLYSLGLSSCNMKEFPHFSRNAEIELGDVDLSNNQIEGEIPHWIGLVDWDSEFSTLNLSHNRLTGDLENLPWNNIRYLDLQSNMLNGSLPNLICNSSSLEILNLSNNKLSGVLPVCPKNLTSLSVFDLRMNNIEGNLPSTLSNFRNLRSLNLYGNKLEGRIPSSFAEFTYLETLDLGSNQINDTFPHCLEALPNLQVLVLKWNQFHGLLNKSFMVEHPFRSLRIIDLSYNDFSGPLPSIYFRNFKAMMNSEVNKIERSYMGNTYYSDSTTLVIKGVEVVLQRILTVFTTVDVSNNNFEGEIVESIGDLVSLRYLNFSYNQLTGHIPSSIGKLSMLESLDLSFNRFEGEIPHQLASINSLARLNLSCNQLTGRIPQGPQFNTFGNDSYADNLALCGYPLSKGCERDLENQKEGEDDDYFFSGFTWNAVVIGYGCGVVPAFVIGYLMLLAGKPKWFVGIIARELGLKIRRMEIKLR